MGKLNRLQIKDIKDVRRRGHRNESLVFVEGERTLNELLERGFVFEELYLAEDKSRPKDLDAKEIFLLTDEEMREICGTQHNAGIAGMIKLNQVSLLLPKKGLILALDGVADPGNLGTILRSAAWFGVSQILIYGGVDPLNDKVIRSSMGAALYTPWKIVSDLKTEILTLKKSGWNTVICDMKGQTDIKPKVRTVLVVGNEAHGVSPEIKLIADQVFAIKGKNGVESLNAAVSAAIALYHFS